MNTMTEGQIFSDVRSMENELMRIFEHFRVVVTGAEEDAYPLSFFDRCPGNLSVFEGLAE